MSSQALWYSLVRTSLLEEKGFPLPKTKLKNELCRASKLNSIKSSLDELIYSPHNTSSGYA